MWQAMAGQQGMVRWLVEERHLSVDVRADVTGATPLMAVVTCCCVPFGAEGDPYSDDGRCREPHASRLEASLGVRMCSLHPMARLLIELGANLAAEDSAGNSVLATAAAAGAEGMWRALTLPGQSILPRAPLDCVPAHAGAILAAIVGAQKPTDPLDIYPENASAALARAGVLWLATEYSHRGWVKRWEAEVNQLVIKRSAAHGRATPPQGSTTCALLAAARCKRRGSMQAAVQLLLELGCRPDGLLPCAAAQGLPLASWRVMAEYAAQWEHPGAPGCSWEVLGPLLAACARDAPSAGEFAAAFEVLQQRIADAIAGNLGKIAHASSKSEASDALAQRARAVNTDLLRRCVQCDTTHALLGVCRVLDSTTWGILARDAMPGLLVAAVRGGRLGHCRALLDRGADVLAADERGEHALWAAAAAREEAAEKAELLCKTLHSRYAERQDEWGGVQARLAAEGPGGVSLAQRAVAFRAHALVLNLSAMGVPLSVAYAGGDPPLRTACTVGPGTLSRCAAPVLATGQSGTSASVCGARLQHVQVHCACNRIRSWCRYCVWHSLHAALCPACCVWALLGTCVSYSGFCLISLCCMLSHAQAGDNKLVQLLVAPSQRGPALRAALQARTREHGLTVLGSVVAWGYVRTMDILAATCRLDSSGLYKVKLASQGFWSCKRLSSIGC